MKTALLKLLACSLLFLEGPELRADVITHVSFTAQEKAGIRRRSDLVSAEFKLFKPVEPATRFRLMTGDKTVPAQIVKRLDAAGKIEAVAIDFIDHFGPYEAREFELQYGAKAATTKLKPTGFELIEDDSEFRIANRNVIEWTVRKDLDGLLRFLLKPDVEYVAEGSAGLVFRAKNGELHRLAEQKPTAVRVTRSGPIACALRFEYADWPRGNRSTVDLEFVRTKSWVLATWIVEGGKDIRGMGSELQLAVSGRETLIDFGAGEFVYTTVSAGQVAVLQAGPYRSPRWEVLRGRAGALEPIVIAPRSEAVNGRAGWAHVMDATRCTAVAVNGFARAAPDRIEIAGNGRMLLYRDFSNRGPVAREFNFGIHFVNMPVHIGARTSPQAMRSPIEVRWETEDTPARQPVE